MAEEINIEKSLSKEEKYQQLIPQISALVQGENNLIANLANISSALKFGMDFFWVGFYLTAPLRTKLRSPSFCGPAPLSDREGELILGPFQGAVACTRIGFGKGVCGTAWKEKKIIVVDDVEKFPGHIACSSESKSEIALPVFDKQKNVFAVLDVDSNQLCAFDKTDEFHLGKIVNLIEKLLP